ncbi:hypothetical protein ACFX11_037705 [Malus domestica]
MVALNKASLNPSSLVLISTSEHTSNNWSCCCPLGEQSQLEIFATGTAGGLDDVDDYRVILDVESDLHVVIVVVFIGSSTSSLIRTAGVVDLGALIPLPRTAGVGGRGRCVVKRSQQATESSSFELGATSERGGLSRLGVGVVLRGRKHPFLVVMTVHCSDFSDNIQKFC